MEAQREGAVIWLGSLLPLAVCTAPVQETTLPRERIALEAGLAPGSVEGVTRAVRPLLDLLEGTLEGERPAASALRERLTPSFRSTLRGLDESTASALPGAAAAALQRFEGEGRAGQEPSSTTPHEAGADVLLERLHSGLGLESPEFHLRVKSVLIERGEDGEPLRARAGIRLEGRGYSSEQDRQLPAQVRAAWELVFELAEEGARLASLEPRQYERVVATGERLARDVTAEVLGQVPAWSEQLARGTEYWRGRLDSSLGVGLLGHQGCAVGDVDGDGQEDVFVAQPGGLPNILLLRTADGGVRDAASEAGLDHLDLTRGALLVELDGDGDLDLVLALADRIVFFENDGAARFRTRFAAESPTVTSLAAADIDLDGDLDVFACGYVTPYEGQAAPVPYHDANNGQPNLLLENLTRSFGSGEEQRVEWRFSNATSRRGLDANNARFSFAASFEDYDRDGDPDLYVANDFGRNNLYRNDDGRFVDVAAELGVEDMAAGMGVTWGDYDLDGRVDLYVSNMDSSAGKRVAFQRGFHEGSSYRADFQRHSRGNTLFRQTEEGLFEDVTEACGVALGRWAWGALFCDLDGDPYPDIYSPNGFVTGSSADDL